MRETSAAGRAACAGNRANRTAAAESWQIGNARSAQQSRFGSRDAQFAMLGQRELRNARHALGERAPRRSCPAREGDFARSRTRYWQRSGAVKWFGCTI